MSEIQKQPELSPWAIVSAIIDEIGKQRSEQNHALLTKELAMIVRRLNCEVVDADIKKITPLENTKGFLVLECTVKIKSAPPVEAFGLHVGRKVTNQELPEQYQTYSKETVALCLWVRGFEFLDADIKEIVPDENMEGSLVFEFHGKIKVLDNQRGGFNFLGSFGYYMSTCCGEVTSPELDKAYIVHEVAETLTALGCETAYAGIPIREWIKAAAHQVVGLDMGESTIENAGSAGGQVTNQELAKAYIVHKVAETVMVLGYETAYSGIPIDERIKAAVHQVVGFDVGGSTTKNVGRGGGEATNQETNKWLKEEDVKKMIDEALKPYIDSGILQKKGEDACIDIGPDKHAEPTSGKAQLMKETAESTLNKVSEIVLATSAQGAFSLLAYASMNSPSSKLAVSPALLGAVGANAVAFTTSLTSLCLRAKKPRASSFLAKVGAVAVIAAVIGAMGIYIPVNIQWVASLAAALPVLAVLYA